LRAIGALILAVVLVAGTAGAQPGPGVIVDQGSFTIAVNGTAVGRETFAIRRTAAGYQASGTVLLADRRLSPVLTTDAVGTPMTYTLDARGGPARVERVSVTRDRGFITLRSRVPEEESVREIPASMPRRAADSSLVGGTVLVDDDIVHQYYFLMLYRREGVVSVLVPQRRMALPVRVERLAPDSIRIGSRELEAERARVTGEPGGECLIWVDATGRVLQLQVPERHLIAVRDSPP
jgi:hypothetical protein